MKRGLALAAAAAPLLAGVAHAAEGAEKSNLFAGDLGNAIWTVVIFVCVLVVLGKFAWGPVLDILQQREEFIRRSLAEAKEDREAAEARLQEYTEKLHEARSEATAIVDEGRRDAEVVKARIEEEAREEAARVVERAKREIEIAKRTAIKEVYEQSARMVTEVAGRVIQKELDTADHERLIADSIRELGEEGIH